MENKYIEGEERINLAKIKNEETDEITSVECDSLILSNSSSSSMNSVLTIIYFPFTNN